MDSGQSRGKLFLIIGGILIIIIIVVTALKNKEPKTTEGNPTLFEGIRNLTRETVDTVTEYLGEQTRKVIPLELKDLDNDSNGIPNVVKLTNTPTAGISIPEESIVSNSPDLPQVLPFPRLITQSSGTINRIGFKDSKPVETLLAKGNTEELFQATFGNNNLHVVARARTISTLTHYLGVMAKNTLNYCPYSLTLNKKNTYTVEELEQMYGLLQVNGVIPASFPAFTDYKTNVQSLIQVYQTQKSLSKKPTGIIDDPTLKLLVTTCSDLTKEEKRAAGEQIPEYILTYKQLANAIEDMIPSKIDASGALQLHVGDGISIGKLADISNPKTYTQIFTTPFTDFNIEYPNTASIIATARPAAGYEGSSYLLDTQTKSRTTLLEGFLSLMTLVSPDGKYTLYVNSSEKMELMILDNQTFESTEVPFITIPDKCAWASDSSFIACGVPVDEVASVETWLRGEASNDEMKAYSLVQDQAIDLPQPTEEVDTYQPVVSSDNHYFGFINRKTMEPWMVSLVDFIK